MGADMVLQGRAVEVAVASDMPALMTQIRPQWQAKGLIERVRRLLLVDPSSACQRLLNAAIADLREKIKIAGIDIAKEAAVANRLPPVSSPDDVDNYSTAKLLDLAYRMGLLTRPEWRRLTRAYDIRRDLEHEDSEYEAGVEDCVYIFKTCIEAVLSKDPVSLIKVAEVKQIVEAVGPAAPDLQLLEDYEHAPDTRHLEILKFLVSTSLSDDEPELVRQNAFAVLGAISGLTRDAVKVGQAPARSTGSTAAHGATRSGRARRWSAPLPASRTTSHVLPQLPRPTSAGRSPLEVARRPRRAASQARRVRRAIGDPRG